MNQERLLSIIESPRLSEKVSMSADNNLYAFKVVSDATKSEIKDAIEFLFNTKVKEVRVVNVKPKRKLFKSVEGKRKGWKKAYVTLQAGQKLDIIDTQ